MLRLRSRRIRLLAVGLVLGLTGCALAAAGAAGVFGGSASARSHNVMANPTILYYSDGKTVLARIGGATVVAADASAEARARTHGALWWPKGPTGLIVGQVLAEVARTGPFHGESSFAMLADGGYRIVTTIDVKAQASLESLVGRDSSTSFMKAQPETMQAAAVVIEPKTGQVLAYYGGESGTGADYAGGTGGRLPGGSGHPPGETFGMYTMAAALQQGLSLRSMWQSPPKMTFPQYGRNDQNPVYDQAKCPTGEEVCSLGDSIVAGLRVPTFAVAGMIGPENLVEAASAAGVDQLVDSSGNACDLEGPHRRPAHSQFGAELGYGQTAITVLDHAVGAATYAADGQHAGTHFVVSVAGPVANGPGTGELVHESVASTGSGLTPDQVADLTWAMSQSPVAKLPDGHLTAAISGQWALPAVPGVPYQYSDAWTVGFTPKLATAVWVGNKSDERPLIDRNGVAVTGHGLPADIYRAFMANALAGQPPTVFREPAFGGDASRGNAQQQPKTGSSTGTSTRVRPSTSAAGV